MKVPFTYYLHDSKEDWYSELEEILDKTSLTETEREVLAQKVGMPFYEVTFTCELDTVTGDVTVKETKL